MKNPGNICQKKRWNILLLVGCLLLSWLFPWKTSAQELTGKVFTISENGDTTVIYMARLQWKGTSVGAYSDAEGTYHLPFAKTDTLVIRYSFYKADTVVVGRNERHRDFFINTAQALQEVVVTKKRQKYVRKGNPAIELVEKVIEHKNENRIETAENYKTTRYEKLVLAFGKFNINVQKNRIHRKFAFLAKYIDTLSFDTVPVLTLSLRETLADLYHQQTPKRDVTYVKAKRMQGADDVLDLEGLDANIKAIFTEVNIFDNDIELMLNRFVSPLSSTFATAYYHYYITDTLEIDGISCIELTFTPVNSRTFGFSGRMYIVNDSTYAVKQYTLSAPKNINLNYVSQLTVNQEFFKNDSGLWAPAVSHTHAKFSIFKRKRQLYARQTTLWYNYQMGTPIPDSLAGGLPVEEVVSPDVRKYKSGRWKQMRPIPLSAKESFLDSLGVELRRLPAYKALEKTAEILSSGYIATAANRKESRFDIGPIYNFISYNPTEGVRLRVGGMTTAKLHDQLFVNGYIAFGCKDLRLKYNLALTYSFVKKQRHVNESPKNAITFSSGYDMEMQGQSYSYIDRDNLLMSYTTDSTQCTAQYVRRTRLRYEREWPSNLRLDTWVQYENSEATGSLAYWRINRDGTLTRVRDFNNIEGCVKLRWAPGEATYNRQSGEKSLFNLSKDAPVITFTHTIGVMDKRFLFNRTELSLEKRFWLSSFGHIDAKLEGGIVWNQVPFPELFVPPSNQSLFLTPNSFCLMKSMEFIMDKYVALYATYYLKGWIFNRIPLWNRLHLREVVSFSGIYGGLSPKNLPTATTTGLYVLPDGCSPMGKVPYMEFTAGIENILSFIRIDYVRRISYAKDLKGWDKNGVRITFRLAF
jgi:hypothetical protein